MLAMLMYTEKWETECRMEEKSRKIPKLNWLLFKNTVAMLIPAVIVFGIVAFIILKYPILYHNTCHTVESLDDMKSWYEKRCYIVRYNDLELKYTGYDYYENDKRLGAYYYSFIDDECLFVLVKTHNPEPILKNESICGRMMSDSAHLGAMIELFVTDTGLDKESFSSVVYPIMISEIDYPLRKMLLIWVFIITPFVISLSFIVMAFTWVIRPFTHPSTKKLAEIGDRFLVYQELNSQLQREDVVHNYHYYFTENYLILNNLFTTDFIRIDFIRYISKHITMRGKRQIYRITMSNPEKMFFEKDFRLEKCADEIMEELIKRNPHIDDRTVHVFNLPGAEKSAEENAEDGSLNVLIAGESSQSVHNTEDGSQDVRNAEESSQDVRNTEEKESDAADGASDAEDMKIYTMRRRLSQMDDDEEEMKIYEVKHRLQKTKDDDASDELK